MEDMKYLALGQRIKKLREKSGLSLKELSKEARIDSKRLEAIEGDAIQPIIAELVQLSKALSVNVADIFRNRPRSKAWEITRKKERELVRPLMNPGPKKILDYSYELLSMPNSRKHMEAYLVTFPPHQSKRPHQDVTHQGEEFLYILEGSISGVIAGDAFVLEEGDSLYFGSLEDHTFFNPHEVPAKAVVVIYPF